MEKYLYLTGYSLVDKSSRTEKRLEKHQPSRWQLEMEKQDFIISILENSEYIPMDKSSKIFIKDTNQSVQMVLGNTQLS